MPVESLYSHDGLRDSLTNLAAPPLFYEELRRELARAKRTESKIVLIRIVLSEGVPATDEDKAKFNPKREILEFGKLIKSASRAEEVCARIGEREFLSLLLGGQIQAESIVTRLNLNWLLKERRLKMLTSYVVSNHGESGLELLNRLDHIDLIEPIEFENHGE